MSPTPTNQFKPEEPTPGQAPKGNIEIITDVPPSKQHESPETQQGEIKFLSELLNLIKTKESQLQASVKQLEERKDQINKEVRELGNEIKNAENEPRLTPGQKQEIPQNLIESLIDKIKESSDITLQLEVTTQLLNDLGSLKKDVYKNDKKIQAQSVQSSQAWQTANPSQHIEAILPMVSEAKSLIESKIDELEQNYALRFKDEKSISVAGAKARREIASNMDIINSSPIVVMILTGGIPEKQHAIERPPVEPVEDHLTHQTISAAVENIGSIEGDIDQEISQTQKNINVTGEDIESAENQKTEINNDLGPLKDEAVETKQSLDQNFSETEDLTNKE